MRILSWVGLYLLTIELLRSLASNALADGAVSASKDQQESPMKRIWLIALTSALATSTMALAVDDASAVTRAGVSRAGVNRVGVNRVGVNRVGVNRVGLNRAGIGYGRA